MALHDTNANRTMTNRVDPWNSRLTSFIVGGVALAAVLFIFFSGTFSARTTLPPTITGAPQVNTQTTIPAPAKN